MYIEYKPNILLTPYIETYWTTDEIVSDKQTLRVLPDGSVNVLFNLEENEDSFIKPFIPYIIGVKTKFTDVIHEKADRMIGIRFRPCAISAFTKVPIYEFNDCRINTDLFPSLFSDFNPEKLIETSNRISQLGYIDNYLLSKLDYCMTLINKLYILQNIFRLPKV